ncbi:YibE/F family protein [Corynebacterium alimapuense]|uniref:YibE/F family protein n=1 Tax=Corynebacterium alimapuense TaxID=1576874 RepID=A0A3M8KAS9_9CORY|nr:YibE/F family protein [Corynebacterium alimapuense]RNE49969.1 YibE/F family protein [Corynebacterium alimapuense]
MGRHHSTSTSTVATSPWRKLLMAFLAFSVAATVIGLWWQWPDAEGPEISPDFATTFSLNHTQVEGTVTLVDSALCNSPSNGTAFEGSPVVPLQQSDESCNRALVDITSGQNAGMQTMLVHYGLPGEPVLEEGDKILLAETPVADGPATYSFSDYQRTTALIIWGVIIALAIVIFAMWRGVRALLGLVITLGGIAIFLLPALLNGGNGLVLALVAGSAILMIVVPLVHGLNWKSASALGGTLIALGAASMLAYFAIDTTHLRGLGDQENLNILLYLPGVSIISLMLCGFIIGALGVLNDVTIAQASTVNELASIDPDATPGRLFIGAMKVGRDHISSMIYTLVLSYTGAALPLLLLLSVAERPLSQTMTSDVVATELLRSGIGALALTLAVPLTTIIAAWTVPDRKILTKAVETMPAEV